MDDLERAIEIALDAYEGQTDKAGETYIRHLLRVMEQVETRRQRIVAVLHDVVEDSAYDLSQIEDTFDAEIRDAVDAITKRDDEDYLDDFIPRVAANDIARPVKLADIEDNMDLTRLPELSDGVLEKQATYHAAWHRLQAE
jgi:GTP pyrophosphokinase